MPCSIRRVALCAGVALTTTLAGCSSSGGSGGTSPTTSPPAQTTTSAAASSGAPTTTGGSPADPATKKAISNAYAAFFDTKTPLKKSMQVLQHGTKFRAALQAESKSPAAQDITAVVNDVQMQSAKVALVTFTLKQKGSDLLPNTHGFAVQEGGHWKVAAQTFCSLLKLEGTAPTVCNDKSITALPN
jgi:hypothetical protein